MVFSSTKIITLTSGNRRLLGRSPKKIQARAQAQAKFAPREIDETSEVHVDSNPASARILESASHLIRTRGEETMGRKAVICAYCAPGVLPGGSGTAQYCCPNRKTTTITSYVTR